MNPLQNSAQQRTMPGTHAVSSIANSDIFHKFREKFFRFTGLDLRFCEIKNEPASNTAQSGKFCRTLMRSSDSSLNQAVNKSLKTKKPVLFTCPGAAAEAVIPVLLDAGVIGLAFTGRVQIRRGSVFKNCPPEMSRGKFRASVELAFFVINYVFRKESELWPGQGDKKKGGYLHEIIATAVKFIKENYRDREININKVAEVIHISPFYFSHIFNKEMHTSFKEYLTGIRLEKTIRMLKELKHETIREIAFLNGYDDPYYFSKVFKKAFKISPSYFRKQFL